MIRFSFKKGLVFTDILIRWMLLRRLFNGALQFENETGEIKVLTDFEVLSLWNQGLWVIDESSLGTQGDAIYLTTPRDLSTFPEKWQKRASRSMHYINAVKADQIKYNPVIWAALIKSAALEINDLDPPASGTVHQWWRQYRTTKSITRLIPKNIAGFQHAREYRYPIFEEVVAEIYLSTLKRKKSEVVQAVNDRIYKLNLGRAKDDQIPIFAKSTIYRWLDQLQQDVVDAARLGSKAARVKYRIAMGGMSVDKILDRVEIDHTPIDLIVIDKLTMLPLGRPWLTLAIDQYSKMILGFYISFNAPSSYAVLQCIKQMILPKDQWLTRFPDVQGKWPAFGIPTLIAVDNGMDLHSLALQKSCLELGIQILFCPVARGDLKGSIERYFRTVSQGLFHRIPGTVFSNIFDRGDYPSEEKACIDMETLLHLINKWIVDIYNVSYHRGIATTPLLKWMQSFEKNGIELPAYPQQLEIIVGIPTKRTVFHYGIELDGLHYNSRTLQEIRRRTGENIQVELKYYEDSVAYINVFDPYIKEYLKVDAVDPSYTKNLHRETHRLSKVHARKVYGENHSHAQLSEARLAIEEIIKAAIKDKKMGMRKNSANVLMHDSEAVLKSKNPISEAMKPVKSAKTLPPEDLPDGLNDELPDLLSKIARQMDFSDKDDDEAPL